MKQESGMAFCDKELPLWLEKVSEYIYVIKKFANPS